MLRVELQHGFMPQRFVKLAGREELSGNDDNMELSPVNYFDTFDDEDLFHRFNLSRPCINFITDYISLRMKKSQTQIRGHSAGGMVMAALDYYANGVVSTTVQDKAGLNSSETHEVVSIISNVISGTMDEFVTFPKTRDARANVANEMKSFCGIPNVLGVVACLHVKVRPAPEDSEVFLNTLEYFSAMTQVICDCEGNFLSVEDCRVGSTPEQSIWESSAIGEQTMQGAHGSNWIIGGRGYGLSSHLLTAVSPVSTEPERRFNAAHAKGLRAMQETLTALKRRFRCLTDLGYSQQDGLEKKADVINACCVLHNVAKKFPSLLDVGVQLEPWHPGGLSQGLLEEVPYQAAKAREELIAAHFSVPSSDLNLQNVQQLSLPEPPLIKEEQYLRTSQGGEQLQRRQSDTFRPLAQTSAVESRERDCLPTNTTEEQIKTESNEEGYGSLQPASNSQPPSVPPDCPTAQSLKEEEEERRGLLPDLKPRRTQAEGSSPIPSSCSSPDTCLGTNTSPSPWTRPIPSSCSGSASEDVSSGEDGSKTADKPYNCEECDKAFSCKSHLVIHKRIHTGEKPYQCKECGKAFRQKGTLVRHGITHTQEQPYQCQECGKNFNCKSNLVVHRRIHTGDKPYQCEECDKVFSVNSSLVEHRRFHTGEKPYQCEECDKVFSVNRSLVEHRRIHTGEKPYQCDECDMAFRVKGNLVKHIRRIHTGEKLYQCQECDKCFSHKNNLMYHRRSHTGVKPYQCQECDKCFSHKKNLMYHRRSHAGVKPYQCQECDEAFSYKTSLMTHRRIHKGEKLYQCQKFDFLDFSE